MDSQLAEFLAELPGVRSDPADGVVAEVELLQSQQAVQPAFTHLRQVVVVQLPAATHAHKVRLYAGFNRKGDAEQNRNLLTGLPCC